MLSHITKDQKQTTTTYPVKGPKAKLTNNLGIKSVAIPFLSKNKFY